MKTKSKPMNRACRYCFDPITEANEVMNCPFGTGCKLCDICHRQIERDAGAEAVRLQREWEWARRKSNAGSSV